MTDEELQTLKKIGARVDEVEPGCHEVTFEGATVVVHCVAFGVSARWTSLEGRTVESTAWSLASSLTWLSAKLLDDRRIIGGAGAARRILMLVNRLMEA